MRTEYAMLRLEHSNNPEMNLMAFPLFYHATKKKLWETTKGFKYVYYPSLWLRDKFGKPMHDAYIKESVRTRKRKFVYLIRTDLRGEYV